MTAQNLLTGFTILAILLHAEARWNITSWLLTKWAALLLPKDERARYSEQWTADLHDTPQALSRLLVALDLFRAGAGVRFQVIEQQLSVRARRVARETRPMRGNIMNTVSAPIRSQTIVLSDSGSGMPARLGVGFISAVFVTVGLLWVMNYLILTTDDTPVDTTPIRFVDYVYVKPTPEPIKRKKPETIKPEPAPDAPPRGNFPDSNESVAITVPMLPPGQVPKDGPTVISLSNEGDLLELVAVRPVYPASAERRGLEGWCIVQFTVTSQGTVVDPVVPENQCSHSLFRKASINAALKFKYKPRVVNGVAVDVPGRTKKFTYVMN